MSQVTPDWVREAERVKALLGDQANAGQQNHYGGYGNPYQAHTDVEWGGPTGAQAPMLDPNTGLFKDTYGYFDQGKIQSITQHSNAMQEALNRGDPVAYKSALEAYRTTTGGLQPVWSYNINPQNLAGNAPHPNDPWNAAYNRANPGANTGVTPQNQNLPWPGTTPVVPSGGRVTDGSVPDNFSSRSQTAQVIDPATGGTVQPRREAGDGIDPATGRPIRPGGPGGDTTQRPGTDPLGRPIRPEVPEYPGSRPPTYPRGGAGIPPPGGGGTPATVNRGGRVPIEGTGWGAGSYVQGASPGNTAMGHFMETSGMPLNLDLDTTDPKKMAQNLQRWSFLTSNAIMANAGELADQFNQSGRVRTDVADRMFRDLYEHPGYLAEDEAMIRNQAGLDEMRFTDEMARENFLREQEQKDIKGDPYAGLGYWEGDLAKREAINPSKLGLSQEYQTRFNFGPQDEQDMINQAGRTVGLAGTAAKEDLIRRAMAEGNTNALGLSAAQNRVQRTSDVGKADAMLNAKIAAKQLGLDVTGRKEATRLGAEQDISNRQIGAAQFGAGLKGQGEAAASQRAQALGINRQDVNMKNQATALDRLKTIDERQSDRARLIADTARADQDKARADARNEGHFQHNLGQGEEARQVSAFGVGAQAPAASYNAAIRGSQVPSAWERIANAGINATLARGGVVGEPTVATVGEAGPEMVVPLTASQPSISQTALGLPNITPTNFARGGMARRPTLARLGEEGPEAVMSMQAPAAMPSDPEEMVMPLELGPMPPPEDTWTPSPKPAGPMPTYPEWERSGGSSLPPDAGGGGGDSVNLPDITITPPPKGPPPRGPGGGGGGTPPVVIPVPPITPRPPRTPPIIVGQTWEPPGKVEPGPEVPGPELPPPLPPDRTVPPPPRVPSYPGKVEQGPKVPWPPLPPPLPVTNIPPPPDVMPPPPYREEVESTFKPIAEGDPFKTDPFGTVGDPNQLVSPPPIREGQIYGNPLAGWDPYWQLPEYNGPPYEDVTTNVKYLARGGVADRPTMARLGEAGPEMVMPLRRPMSYQRRGEYAAR